MKNSAQCRAILAKVDIAYYDKDVKWLEGHGTILGEDNSSLTDAENRYIMMRADACWSELICALCNGELSPLQMAYRVKPRSIYIKYALYFLRPLYLENPRKAAQLLAKITKDIYGNDNLPLKDWWTYHAEMVVNSEQWCGKNPLKK